MTKRLLLATVVSWLVLHGPAAASSMDVLIGLDSKVVYGEQGQQNVAPGVDAVVVMDISNPAHPRIRASLPLVNSLLGPPTNLQITPVIRRLVVLAEGAAAMAVSPSLLVREA